MQRRTLSGMNPSREVMMVLSITSRRQCFFPPSRRLIQRRLLSSEGSDDDFYIDNRIFPSKEELDNREGEILIRQTQRTFPIDVDLTTLQVRELLRLSGCSNMDVGIWLSSDRNVRRLNTEYRHKRKSTDILSFPFHEDLVPGEKPECSIEDELNLGDMILSVPYVGRACARDLNDCKRIGAAAWEEEAIETRGVSGAMMGLWTPRERVPLLLIHGLCHLRGYDHEDDDEFLEMVTEEERLLQGLVRADLIDASVLKAVRPESQTSLSS